MPDEDYIVIKDKREKVFTDIADTEIDQYKQDLEGLTVKKLNFGLSMVQSQKLRYKLLIIFLVLVSAASWGISFYYFGQYVVAGVKEDDLMLLAISQDQVVGHEYTAAITAQDIIYREMKMFDTGNGRVDIAALIENPNQDYYAQFDYLLLNGGKTLATEPGFILPRESKYLMYLAQEIPEASRQGRIKIENLTWHRINRHNIPDWPNFKKEHLDLTIDNLAFADSQANEEKFGQPVNQLDFDVFNRSPYNYEKANFAILLKEGGALVGINKYNLEQLLSAEKKTLSLRWPGRHGRVETVQVVPEIDILDKDNYIRFEGDPEYDYFEQED